MIPATQTLKDAIASPGRKPVLQITLTLGGADYVFETGTGLDMITGYSLQRTPQDQVIRASQISGTIAAQCNFTLQGWQATVDGGFLSSSDLSIYKAGFDALRDNDYGIDAGVTVRQGYVTTAGVETVQVFVGYVDRIAFGDEGQVSFTCLDNAKKMQATGANAVIPLKVHPEAFVEDLLRQAGFYRTPEPLPGTVFWMPNAVVVIGDPAKWFGPPTRTLRFAADGELPANWTSTMARGGPNGSIYYQAPGPSDVAMGTIGTTSVVEAAHIWAPDPDNFMMGSDAGMIITAGMLLTAGDPSLYIGPRGNFVDTGVDLPSDQNAHYLMFDVSLVSASTFNWYLNLDGNEYQGSGSYSRSGWYWGINVLGDNYVEGFSVRVVKTDGYVRQPRPDWTPPFEAVWRGSAPLLLPAVAKTGKIIDLINEIADGVGARWRWTEDGTFLWENAPEIRDSLFDNAVAGVDDTRALLSSGYSYDGASKMASVSMGYQVRKYVSRTFTTDDPIWSSDDGLTLAANSKETLRVTTTDPIAETTDVWWTAVKAEQAGDPSAVVLDRYSATAYLSVSKVGLNELTIVVGNLLPYPITFWDPTGSRPPLAVYALAYGVEEERRTFMQGGQGAIESISLPESVWVQDKDATQARTDAIAAEASLPAIVFDQLRTVGDPTRTVGDVINLQAAGLMDAPIPCVIIGKDNDLDEDTLTVVPCYPPTGWVLGAEGRSEIGNDTTDTTAILVA